MTTIPLAAPGRGWSAGLLPRWLVAGLAGYLLLLMAVLFVFAQPQIDETYYWLWGQHPDLTYIDHPPLHAWLQWLVSRLFGWNTFALRALSLVTTGATFWLAWVWVKRLAPDRPRYVFWLTVALSLSTPLMLFYLTLAVHDRLLLVLVLLSGHFFADYAARWAEDRRTALWRLYLAAVLLGLATLTKYVGVLAGIGFALALLASPQTRRLYLTPHLWLAALLAMAMQAPLLIWNLQHDFLSFGFHLTSNSRLQFSHIQWVELRAVLLEALLFISPFCLWGMVGFAVHRQRPGFGGALFNLNRGVFVVSTAAMLVLSATLSRNVLPYWNMLAYSAFFMLSAWFIRSRLLIVLQGLFGVVTGTILVVHFSFFPILDGRVGLRSGNLYGWEQVAREVRRAMAETGADFATADTWEEAAQLAFALGDPDVPALTPTIDAFDQWYDPSGLAGHDAIVIVRGKFAAHAATLFDSFEPYRSFDSMVFGHHAYTYRLYLGRGFRAEAAGGLP